MKTLRVEESNAVRQAVRAWRRQEGVPGPPPAHRLDQAVVREQPLGLPGTRFAAPVGGKMASDGERGAIAFRIAETESDAFIHESME